MSMIPPVEPTSIPAPAAAPAQADPALVEQIRGQLVNELFDGKYKSPAEAKKGYWEQNKYVGQLESLVNSGGAPTAPAANDPFKRLAEESLIPMDAFQAASRSMIREELSAIFGPISGALQAREQLVATIPQYSQDEPKVLAFANQHPELSQKTQAMSAAGFPLEALQLQYQAYLLAHPPTSTPAPDPRAGLPGTPGSDPNRNPAQQAATDETARRLSGAVQHALQTRDENPLWNEVFKDFKPKLPSGFQTGN